MRWSKHTIGRCVAVGLMTWLGAVCPASGARWFARVWQVDDGLPGDTVASVMQSADGYLWFATQSGLGRFDGLRMVNVPVAVGRAQPLIHAAFIDREDRFWLAEDGGFVVRMAGGEARLFSRTNGISRARAVDMVQTADGAVWISFLDGTVARIHHNQVEAYGETNGPPGSGVCRLAVDGRGQLWFVRGGQIGMRQGEEFTPRLLLPERFAQMLAARSGGFWVCAAGRLLKYDGGTNVQELATLAADGSPRPTALWEDRAGSLWIGTSAHGLFVWDGKNLEQVETSHARVRSILEDREASIWVGTDGGGLNRLRRQVVELQGKNEGLPFDTVRSVCEDPGGTIWAVLQDAQLARHDARGWRTVSSLRSWPGGQATCVTSDANGVVWIGTYLRGLYRLENGEYTVLRRADGLAASSIRSLLCDRAGKLWIAYSTGDVLQRYRDGKFEDFDLPPNSRPIRTLCEDAAGDIWMANLDARLLRVTGGEVRDETWRTNEPYRPIRCLTATADGSVWIGYSTAGLARLKDGKFKRINEEQGLFDNSICSLMPDNHGWMWIGSDHGIFRASLGDLEAVMDGRSDFLRCISHGKDDALPSLQAYYGYSPGPARTRDGRILIPTRLGLAIARPEFAPTNYVAPPAIIESVQVDAEELAGTAGPRELWPRHRKLEFRYTAPSFLDPERIRFRYRLDGFDAGWVDAGAERVARYPRLPAGEYRFQVQAESHGGTATEPAASFAFRVPPFLWQRWWFLLGAAGALLAGVYWVVRLVAVRRLRAQVARLEQENALQRERARIAQDIHDEFGARMTQISLLAERTQYALAYPAKANDLVGRIAQMSRQGIKSLDEIVWAVNPRNDTLQDLLDYAGQYAVDFLQAAGIRCRVDFPDHPRDRNLPADVRHGLFLAVKEALNNVVKHAGATEVWLRVHEADDTLTWVIEDDGHGFERGPGSPQTDGLRNMQQRLAQFGGRCEVEGRPGQGARVKFELRLPAPYAGPPT